MKHYPDNEWMLYIKDQLPQSSREKMEEHLLTCDACLALYMEQVELAEFPAALPESILGAGLVNQVMHRVTSDERRRRTSSFRRRLLHYAVAAAVTFLLMASGIFQSMVSSDPLNGLNAGKPPISDQVMEKALSIFDQIDKGGNR
jgi:anti-sigma factor RsiW